MPFILKKILNKAEATNGPELQQVAIRARELITQGVLVHQELSLEDVPSLLINRMGSNDAATTPVLASSPSNCWSAVTVILILVCSAFLSILMTGGRLPFFLPKNFRQPKNKNPLCPRK